MMTSCIGGDFSKVEQIAAIAEDLEASFAESGVTDFGKIPNARNLSTPPPVH